MPEEAEIDTDRPLDEADVDPDPLVEFHRWFALAHRAGEPQPNAMALATADAAGEPTVRMVLLYRAEPSGFSFFTNYESDKAAALAVNPRAALAFYWPRLHRQVRVQGTVSRVSRQESEAYWAERPYGNRIAASASPQSRVISSRKMLEIEVAKLQKVYPIGPPLPEFWGGYRLAARTLEFWQGRSHRLHDRLRYVRTDGRWRVERLAP